MHLIIKRNNCNSVQPHIDYPVLKMNYNFQGQNETKFNSVEGRANFNCVYVSILWKYFNLKNCPGTVKINISSL